MHVASGAPAGYCSWGDLDFSTFKLILPLIALGSLRKSLRSPAVEASCWQAKAPATPAFTQETIFQMELLGHS